MFGTGGVLCFACCFVTAIWFFEDLYFDKSCNFFVNLTQVRCNQSYRKYLKRE